MDDVISYMPLILRGTMVTIAVSVASIILAVMLGLLGAWAKLSKSTVAQMTAGAYTTLVRGVPDLVLMLLIFYGGQQLLNDLGDSTGLWGYIEIDQFSAGVMAIGFIFGAYMTETFRGAFLGVDPGQIEAARALGLSGLQTFVYVRIPAMWRLALPPFGNHMLSLIKDTALIAIIGLEETLFVAEQAIGTTGKPFTMYILVGLIYLGFSTFITLTVMALEKYANRHLEAAR